MRQRVQDFQLQGGCRDPVWWFNGLEYELSKVGMAHGYLLNAIAKGLEWLLDGTRTSDVNKMMEVEVASWIWHSNIHTGLNRTMVGVQGIPRVGSPEDIGYELHVALTIPANQRPTVDVTWESPF
jgi:hypothetical protein